MSRKRVLNLTSVKKRDARLSYTNVTAAAPVGGTTFGTGSAVLLGNNVYEFLWIASAMDLGTSPTLNPVANPSLRSSTDCYIVGLSEKVRVQTNSSIHWSWRRIVFTLKGTVFVNVQTAVKPLATYDATDGWMRTVGNWTNDTNLKQFVFRGSEGKDWDDTLTASPDTTLITVLMDKTMQIKSGNDSGVNQVKSFWIPIRKNLRYGDDEAGSGTATSPYSTFNKVGCGDVYVYDIIIPVTGSTTSDQLLWNPAATLYWHEK